MGQKFKNRSGYQKTTINECMFKNHKKKSKQSKQSNEEDDVVVDDDEEDIDFIEIGDNVFLNKKNDQEYEIADDDDLNEDLF